MTLEALINAIHTGISYVQSRVGAILRGIYIQLKVIPYTSRNQDPYNPLLRWIE